MPHNKRMNRSRLAFAIFRDQLLVQPNFRPGYPGRSADLLKMLTPKPQCNLIVIRSRDIDRAVTFYQLVGLDFQRHAHGNGPEHYSAEMDGLVFEIYPQSTSAQSSCEIRLGFRVHDVDSVLAALFAAGGQVIAKPKDSEWGRGAVIKDFDGISVELTSP